MVDVGHRVRVDADVLQRAAGGDPEALGEEEALRRVLRQDRLLDVAGNLTDEKSGGGASPGCHQVWGSASSIQSPSPCSSTSSPRR